MNNYRRILWFIGILGFCLIKELYAGEPSLATYRYGGCQIFWFVQVSDIHIDTTSSRSQRLTWILTDLLNVVEPLLIIVTGDLVDASEGGMIPNKGQSVAEWTEYRNIVDSAGMTFDTYIDVIGNHDHYNDPGNTYYRFYSIAGRYNNSTQHSVRYVLPFGVYHFLFADTTANDDRNFPWDCSELSPEELDFLRQELNNNSDANLTFIMGHHSYNDIGYTHSFCYLPGEENRDRGHSEYINLIQSSNAFYFHGHEHETTIYNTHNIITFEVNSWGKSGDQSNFAIYAIDNDSLSVGYGTIVNPWPVILITAPASLRYSEDTPNPYAYSVETGCNNNPVRALVFDETTLQVWFKIDNGNWNTMVPHPQIPHLYQGEFDGSLIAPGEHQLTVEAAGSSLKSKTISFRVIEGPCTIEYEENGCREDGDGDTDGDGDIDIESDIGMDTTEDTTEIRDDSLEIDHQEINMVDTINDLKEDLPSINEKGEGCSCRIVS